MSIWEPKLGSSTFTKYVNFTASLLLFFFELRHLSFYTTLCGLRVSWDCSLPLFVEWFSSSFLHPELKKPSYYYDHSSSYCTSLGLKFLADVAHALSFSHCYLRTLLRGDERGNKRIRQGTNLKQRNQLKFVLKSHTDNNFIHIYNQHPSPIYNICW